jgi:hypothetical protein
VVLPLLLDVDPPPLLLDVDPPPLLLDVDPPPLDDDAPVPSFFTWPGGPLVPWSLELDVVPLDVLVDAHSVASGT